MEDSQIAAALSRRLAERIGAERFALWFGSHTRLCVGTRSLRVCATNAFVRDWLRKHLADDIRACWQAVSGCSLPVEFEVEDAVPIGRQAAPACGEQGGSRTAAAAAACSASPPATSTSRQLPAAVSLSPVARPPSPATLRIAPSAKTFLVVCE